MTQIITISGMLGSGKSTVAKQLASQIGYEHYSTGSAARKIAEQKGINISDYNSLTLADKNIDKEIDGCFIDLKNHNKNYVVDSRLAFFFLPDSLKVKLNVEILVAATRIFNDNERSQERKYKDIEETIAIIEQRRKLEVDRWQEIYGVNIEDNDNFDLIIDTTSKTVDEVCEIIKIAAKV